MDPQKPGDGSKPILYYFGFSAPSHKVRIALEEKGVDVVLRPVDLLNGEQHQDWYLAMNPKGEVPVLQHGDQIITDSNEIIKYVDKNFGRPDQLITGSVEKLLELFDTVSTFYLTYGLIFHYESGDITSCLRFPYGNPEMIPKYKKHMLTRTEVLRKAAAKHQGTEPERALSSKADSFRMEVFTDRSAYDEVLAQVESVLDEVEQTLADPDRVGTWLTGPTFTAADIALTAILNRIYQLGLDEKLWKNGVRPHLSVYAESAFERESVLNVTAWKEHQHKVMKIKSDDEESISTAQWGLGAAVALAALYVYKKFAK